MKPGIETAGSEPRRGPGRPPAPIDEQRRQVFDAALPLFAEYGVAGVPVTKIIEASGLASSSFYRIFTGKWDVLDRVVREAFERASAVIEEGKRGLPRDPVERLRGYVRLLIDVGTGELVELLPHLRRMSVHGMPSELEPFATEADARTLRVTREYLTDIALAGRLRDVDLDRASELVTTIVDHAIIRGTPDATTCADFVVAALVPDGKERP